MLAIIALFALIALVGVAAFGALAGAVLMVIATPADRPIQLPPRVAGMVLAFISLVVFEVSIDVIAGQIV